MALPGIPRHPRRCYVGHVPRSSLARGLALLFALSGAFAVPLAALTHGYAHQHEAADHHAMTHDVVIAETRDHGDDEHPHLTVGTALTSKAATQLLALIPQRVTLPAATVVQAMPPIAEATVEHRAQLAQAPPPRLRAPPA